MQDPNTYKLLTPGPLTTSLTVRTEMLVDRCTWDKDYKDMTQEVRSSLLELAHADPKDYTTVLMQGSGTFGVESVLSSIPGENDCVLVLVNGAYTERMCQILTYHRIHFKRLDFAWDSIPDAKEVEEFLKVNPDVTMVAMVHSETTTGILNDIAAIGTVVKAAGKTFIVDAMSSFGGVDINVPKIGIDFLVSSANKCIQGVPGFSFIIARIEKLQASKGNTRSLSLDLYDQWRVMEKDGGKWRFTSPTHVVAAFHRAISELKEEGGIAVRNARYAKCNQMLRDGMKELGFEAYIDASKSGYRPDMVVTADDTNGFGRPWPYMVFENMRRLGLQDVRRIVKVGDTVSDMREGKNAGLIAVGVVEGSSIIGLDKASWDKLSDMDRFALRKKARETFFANGADFVIDTIGELPGLIEAIEKGERA